MTSFSLPSQNAMQIVGFMEVEVQSVLELVAAVLKLGNIEFKPESRCNGTDESRIKDKNGEFDHVEMKLMTYFNFNFSGLAYLLMIA